ncbi:MAG: polysaccharide biosynthesis C-terminal domain-containing protein, partial [Clostridia bacterium]|nr:polysaccharide biosynthesis C-terminal domain-containing protein [Clostridia bacterium]
FLTTVFLTVSARLYREFAPRTIRKETVRALLRFSLPLIPGLLLWWVISVSDRYLLTWMVGSEENGLYVAAAKIPTIMTLLCTVFLTAWKTSAVTEDGGSDEEAKARKGAFYGNVYRGFVALLFCAAACITLFSKLFAKILFSADFYIAWQYIPILTIGTVFYNLSRFLGSVYFVKEKSLRSSITAAVAAAVNVVLNLLLIPRFGAFGAAGATFAAYLIEYLVRDVDAQREIRFPAQRLRIYGCGILLTAEVVVVTLAPSYWIAASAVLTALILAFSMKPLFSMLNGLLKMIRSKKVYK